MAVSNKCVNKWKPDWVTRTEVPYSSFCGHTSGRDIQSNVYKLQVLDEKGKAISIFAAGIPNICNPLVRPVVPAHILDAFSHLHLADDFDNTSPLELDILIGLDYYWSLITPKDPVQVGETVAMESLFGWILSGNIGKFSVSGMSSTSAFMSSSFQLLCVSEVLILMCQNFGIWKLLELPVKNIRRILKIKCFFFMNGNTERATCALSRVCIP